MSCHTPLGKKLTVQKKIDTHPMYNRLREKIKNASATCDTKPPKLHVNTFLKARDRRNDFLRCKQLVVENLKLIGKINRIQRSHGLTENYDMQLDGCRRSRLRKVWLRIDKYEKENFELAKKCLCPRGRLPTRDQLMEQWKKTIKKIKKRATKPIVLKSLMKSDIYKEISVNPLWPLVYLNLMMKGEERLLGRLEVVLFYDAVPKLVTNFIALCANKKFQKSKNENNAIAQPSLLGTSFYRIFPGLYLEGGDMLFENGCGGMAADGIDFVPDNFDVSHDCPGTLAMIPNEDGKVNSRFTISFKPLNCLNGKRPAFGRVVRGLTLLASFQSDGTKNGKPKNEIFISGCGLLNK